MAPWFFSELPAIAQEDVEANFDPITGILSCRDRAVEQVLQAPKASHDLRFFSIECWRGAVHLPKSRVK